MKDGLSKKAAQAKEHAASGNFDLAERLQVEVNAGNELIKTKTREFENVLKCWKDAKACKDMYMKDAKYGLAGQWDAVLQPLQSRLESYLNAKTLEQSTTRTRKRKALPITRGDSIEEENEEESSEEENEEDGSEEEENEEDGEVPVDPLKDKRHKAARPKIVTSHKLKDKSKQNRGQGRAAKKCSGKHTYDQFQAKLKKG